MDPDEDLGDAEDLRMIYLPSFQIADPDRIADELQQAKAFHAWLKSQDRAGVLIGACGASVLHLAAAGLLNERQVAVHHRLLVPFRRLFPRAIIDQLHKICVSANLVSCGLDAHDATLVLWMFEKAFSGSIARSLRQREPTGVDTASLRESTDPIVAQAQMWIRERFAREFSIADLAAELGVGHQSLIRRFRLAGVGTPRAFVQRIRIDSASSMLIETRRSVTDIAQLVGYTDVSFFRRIFRNATGLSPSAFRKRPITAMSG